MKCPNQECGKECRGKFCDECGTRLPPRRADVITCRGKDDDGELCIEPLKINQKYCNNCGRKIDLSDFEIVKCHLCGDDYHRVEKRCLKCMKQEAGGKLVQIMQVFNVPPWYPVL
ncbi:hypothetical protein DPMN_054226 [Dreissena polymorpha]|uniref:DZANK-type domain-containing protein n=1 Tax=Dreissena polymorpha TaxID=45954 RepID=A0A9D4CPH9_DREPO|nr:hypothetical protein DPMN_054226 [Dreissena polymorpha]